MEFKAVAKFIRISPRKIRLVLDAIRGMKLADAEHALAVMQKKGAGPVLKLIRSAAANAEHNGKVKRETLFIHSIQADAGITIKRFRARAFGRAAMVRKRTSNLTVILKQLPGTETVEKKKGTKKAAMKKAAPQKAASKKVTDTAEKPAAKDAAPKKSSKGETK